MSGMIQTKESLYDSFPVPIRLFDDFHDTPLTIGVYSLLARLYLIRKDAIALSSGDIQRYDKTLSRGAIVRAFDRLVRGGWLIENCGKRGCKIRYIPAWGLINGEARPWKIGTPSLNRPSHVRTLRLEKNLLDVCIGRLAPHETKVALVTRCRDTAEIGLTDIGCYGLTLFGKPTPTDALVRCGLICDGYALPVPKRPDNRTRKQSHALAGTSGSKSVATEEERPIHPIQGSIVGTSENKSDDTVYVDDRSNSTSTTNDATQPLYAPEASEQAPMNTGGLEERSGEYRDRPFSALFPGVLLRPNLYGNIIVMVLIYMITRVIGKIGLGTYAHYAWKRHKQAFFMRISVDEGNPGNPGKQGEIGDKHVLADAALLPTSSKDIDSNTDATSTGTGQRPDSSSPCSPVYSMTHTNEARIPSTLQRTEGPDRVSDVPCSGPPKTVETGTGTTRENALLCTTNSTETVASALRAIGVHPRSIALLADMPLDLVQDVIARGQARYDIRNLAAWVVAALREEQAQRAEHARVGSPAQPAPVLQSAQHKQEPTPNTLTPPAYGGGRNSDQYRRSRHTERHGELAMNGDDIWASILALGESLRNNSKPVTDDVQANIQEERAPDIHPHDSTDSAPVVGCSDGTVINGTLQRIDSTDSVPVVGCSGELPVVPSPDLTNNTPLCVSHEESPPPTTESQTDIGGVLQAALDARNYYRARYCFEQAVRHGTVTHEEQQIFEQAIEHLKYELEQERLAAARLSRERHRSRHRGGSLSRVGQVPVG